MSRIAEIRRLRETNEAPEQPAQTIKRKFPFDFWGLVKNRMLMGYARYGAGYSAINEQIIMDSRETTEIRILSKFIQFVKTGNLEFLIDVVTYCCLLWRWGDHTTYFKAVERHEVAELKAHCDALAKKLIVDIKE